MRVLPYLPRLSLLRRLLAGMLVLLTVSADAGAWWNEQWTVRKKITLDTTATGGAISDPIGTTTVLVRLYEGNFPFGTARDDGSDIRFVAADDKTPLKYHIEKYDSTLYEAFVWVKVPDVMPGAQVTFWLYSGNASEQAARGDDAKGTYDADSLLTYHFGETAGAPVDVTAGAHNAENAGIAASGSLIAGGLRLAGQAGVIIPLAADLAWAEGSAATISAWVKPTMLAPGAILLSRREGDRALVIGLDNGVPYVEVTGAAGPQRSKPATGTPLEVNVWRHFAVTASGAQLTVWLDGESYATLAAGLPALNAPIILGKEKAAEGTTDNAPVTFVGDIDELQIAKVARPAGWLKFTALNQAGGEKTAKLLVFAEDEASKHGGEGEIAKHLSLLVDISKSLTIDGWVVIGLCAILAVVGWGVAVAKFLYLNKIKKATNTFLSHWEQISGNLHVLDNGDEETVKSMGGKATPKTQKAMRQSPLYHIYQIGFGEIQDRLATARENFGGLSGRSMQAIRATLDGGLVREVQKLNSSLVFLTIGIAGGPYLGLLGTVIGVMITFAVIAKSGQVEVNSIAPGIAGALLATVAGLAVAIPALFAYSYISSRIKDAVSDMHVFIDEFVAKIAEFYSEPKR